MWWHNLLLAGKKVSLVGGSDYHRDWHPVLFAHPVTRVFAKSSSSAHILDGIYKGHAYVAATKSSVELGLSVATHGGETAIMGDTVKWQSGLELTATAKNLGIGMVLKLVTAEGVVHTWRKNELPARVEIMPKWRFAYLMAERQISRFRRIAAITNPIYIE